MRRSTGTADIGWPEVFDGLNEVSKKIYFIIFDRFRQRGFFDRFPQEDVAVADLQSSFGIDATRGHRFRVALQALRAIGVLEIRGDRVVLLRTDRPDEPVDDELISTVFGPTMGEYLEIYRKDLLLHPEFALTFDGRQAELWEGLLNAPVNTVGGDQAVRWIGSPGARVLELAFGPGGTIPPLLDIVGGSGEVFGVDSSPYYVDRARKAFGTCASVKKLIEADINEGLSYFEDEMFDGVMFMGALQFVPEPARLFDELGRIVKRRGKLVLGAFHTDKPCFANPALHLHMNLFDPPALEHPVERVKTWLRESGFETNITVEFGSYCSLYAERLPDVLFV